MDISMSYQRLLQRGRTLRFVRHEPMMTIYIFIYAFTFIAAGWVILSFQGLMSRSKAFQGVFGISPSAIILVSLGVAESQYGNAVLHCTRAYLSHSNHHLYIWLYFTIIASSPQILFNSMPSKYSISYRQC